MKIIKVKAPAKINLTLEVLNKREDGFHNIKSIMQAINLYDYLTFKVDKSNKTEIILSGNSTEIPYNEKNLVHKAAVKFLETANINAKINIDIEKNIPVAAGLAGGSTDAAATFFALNKIFDNILTDSKINELCASLGSDLNFCLYGGAAICTSRGELIEKTKAADIDISLVKPKSFGISAKEAYSKFAMLKDKSVPNNTEKLQKLLENNELDKTLLYNSLENAVINDYEELKFMKKSMKNSMMSGSGPTFFVLSNKTDFDFDKNKYIVIEKLHTISTGVEIA